MPVRQRETEFCSGQPAQASSLLSFSLAKAYNVNNLNRSQCDKSYKMMAILRNFCPTILSPLDQIENVFWPILRLSGRPCWTPPILNWGDRPLEISSSHLDYYEAACSGEWGPLKYINGNEERMCRSLVSAKTPFSQGRCLLTEAGVRTQRGKRLNFEFLKDQGRWKLKTRISRIYNMLMSTI